MHVVMPPSSFSIIITHPRENFITGSLPPGAISMITIVVISPVEPVNIPRRAASGVFVPFIVSLHIKNFDGEGQKIIPTFLTNGIQRTQ
jgi:hypothetical protein